MKTAPDKGAPTNTKSRPSASGLDLERKKEPEDMELSRTAEAEWSRFLLTTGGAVEQSETEGGSPRSGFYQFVDSGTNTLKIPCNIKVAYSEYIQTLGAEIIHADFVLLQSFRLTML